MWNERNLSVLRVRTTRMVGNEGETVSLKHQSIIMALGLRTGIRARVGLIVTWRPEEGKSTIDMAKVAAMTRHPATLVLKPHTEERGVEKGKIVANGMAEARPAGWHPATKTLHSRRGLVELLPNTKPPHPRISTRLRRDPRVLEMKSPMQVISPPDMWALQPHTGLSRLRRAPRATHRRRDTDKWMPRKRVEENSSKATLGEAVAAIKDPGVQAQQPLTDRMRHHLDTDVVQ